MPETETRLGAARVAWIVGLSALSVGMGLGRAGRLTYHEAFVAQEQADRDGHGHRAEHPDIEWNPARPALRLLRHGRGQRFVILCQHRISLDW